jgi:hypothetical protein
MYVVVVCFLSLNRMAWFAIRPDPNQNSMARRQARALMVKRITKDSTPHKKNNLYPNQVRQAAWYILDICTNNG